MSYQIKPFLSNILNSSRWIAAGMVVLGHLRSPIFKDYPLVTNKSILINFFYFITGFGHEAVIIFFV